MSNKVSNIYIDTTGFCDEAIERVKKALDTIVEYNGVDDVMPSRFDASCDETAFFFDNIGLWWLRTVSNPLLSGVKQVGLWELESIAFRCKQEKKEESLPTRNIYIDARKLDQEQRRNAFAAITALRAGDENGWLPSRLAHSECDADYILFDIFALNNDGNRLFFSGDHIIGIGDHINNPKELTYDQLMSLTR